MKKQAFNPYLPSWEYVPDGEPYVFDGRVYVYGSHDMYNGFVFCSNDYVCWSAPVDDLGDWRYEGVIYKKTQDPANARGNAVLYAPDVVVGPDGRYYLYYCLDKFGFVSVAVCDKPAGQYEFYGYVKYQDGVRYGDKETDEPQFDPGVLREGDNTYLFTGFSGRGDKSRHGSMMTILDTDMLTIKRGPEYVVPSSAYSEGTGYEGHAFFEASSIRKRGNLYYLVYSSEVMHELCYAISERPDGGYKYGGVIVSNADIGIDSYKPADMPTGFGGNNHGSIIEINGKWYIFYHRQTNGTWYSRQGCAEPIEFTEDGHIIQAEMTSCGLNGGPLSDQGFYPAYLACNMFMDKPVLYVNPQVHKIVMDGKDGDEEIGYIANMSHNSTAGFKYFDCHGVKGIRIETRAYGHGDFEVRTEWDGEVLGRMTVDNSNIWESYSCDINIPDGVHAIYITFAGNGSMMLRGFELLH